MRPWCGGLVLLVLVGALTAGGGGPYEAVVKEMLTNLEQMSATLMTVTDEDTAKAARPDLKKAADAWLVARKKADALPPPEPDVKDKLAKEYKPKLDASVKKLFGQVLRVQEVRGGKDALQEIAGVLNKSGQ
jgi:uroporphyrinogen-III decarboxylase